MPHATRHDKQSDRNGRRAVPRGYPSWPILVVVSATFAAFSGALNNDFVNWDDQGVIVDNPHIRGFTLDHLRWMFTAAFAGHYQPLTWLSYAADYILWGGVSAFGIHLTNVLLHGLTAVLFFFLCRRLMVSQQPPEAAPTAATSAELAGWWFRRFGNVELSALTATLFFAVHPLRVESVAWATERRDVLSGFWLTAAVLCYMRAVQPLATRPASGHTDGTRWAASGYGRWMVTAWLFFVASLFSKAWGIVLPAVLFVLDAYPLRRIGGARGWKRRGASRVWLEKLAFLVPAIVFAVLAGWAQRQAGALRTLDDLPIQRRVAQAIHALGFYLYKTVWPVELAPLYERSLTAPPLDAPVVISAAALIALAGAAWLGRRRLPALAVALATYVIVVSPVLGIAQSGPQFAADRYTYLSCMSWAVGLGAWVARRFAVRRDPSFRRAVGLAIALVGILLIQRTRSQVTVWRDSHALWSHMLAVDPDSPQGHVGLASALRDRALQTGDGDLLRQAYELDLRAIELRPDFLVAQVAAGRDAAGLGDAAVALRHFDDALRFQTDYLDALLGRAEALRALGRCDEALPAFEKLLERDPDSREGLLGWAECLLSEGRPHEAASAFRRVLDLAETAGAEEGLSDAASFGWGRALEAGGDVAAAIAAYAQAARRPGAHVMLHARLAWLLATTRDDALRDPALALHHARIASDSSADRPVVVDEALAAAHAAHGEFARAVEILDARLAIAPAGDPPEWVARLRHQRDEYAQGRALRE